MSFKFDVFSFEDSFQISSFLIQVLTVNFPYQVHHRSLRWPTVNLNLTAHAFHAFLHVFQPVAFELGGGHIKAFAVVGNGDAVTVVRAVEGHGHPACFGMFGHVVQRFFHYQEERALEVGIEFEIGFLFGEIEGDFEGGILEELHDIGPEVGEEALKIVAVGVDGPDDFSQTVHRFARGGNNFL